MPTSPVTASELKGESPTPTSRRDLLAVLVYAAVIVGTANVLAGVALERWDPNLGYTVLRSKWRMLDRLADPVDWLVLGDSSANQGVDPRVLQARLGGRALNLATIADALAVNDAWMLERYLARFGPPRAVVLVHTYDMWQRELVDPLVAEVPRPWGYWRESRPRLDLDPSRALKLAVLRYLPLYSRQESLLMLMRGWVDPRTFPRLTEEGFMEVRTADRLQLEADRHEHLTAARRRQFRMSDHNRQALTEIRALSNRYQFDVFLAGAPLDAALYHDASFRAYHEDVNEALADWVSVNRRWHHVFREPMLFTEDLMQSVDHVTAPGAARYSAALAAEIAPLVPPVPAEGFESRLAPQTSGAFAVTP